MLVTAILASQHASSIIRRVIVGSITRPKV